MTDYRNTVETLVLEPDQNALTYSAELLRKGELVAFPTETVYGLGANALDADAVRSIFAAKERPADNPLIVHIWHRDQLDALCEVSETARKLMDHFWPGPLTILFPRKSIVPDVVTAGLPTVAIRMPSHPVAQAVLRVSGVPVAAPSANRSGRPSPTSAAHVYEDMHGRIPLILDGGSCAVGLESTVLSLEGERPCVLRPGGVTVEMLRDVLGEVDIAPSVMKPLQPGEKVLSPGMKYRHYAPKGTVTLIEGDTDRCLRAMKKLYQEAEDDGKNVCLFCFDEQRAELQGLRVCFLGSRKCPEETAARLFDLLRRMDTENVDVIYSEVVPVEGIGLAVMNRLGRAAAFRTIRADEVL